jgi:hypothetical protein
VKLEAILDPANLILLTRNFIEQDYISDERLPSCLVSFFDLTMIYATVMQGERYVFISSLLFEHTCFLLQTAISRVELFAEKEDLLKRLTESGLIKQRIEQIDADRIRENIR